MKQKVTHLESASLNWNDDGHPYSTVFNDNYYSLINGLEESVHVFVEGNNLLNRWGDLTENQSFCIAETGFGSGLNFLNCWHLWQKNNLGQNNKLHFISVEAYPMTRQQLQQSQEIWHEQFADLSATLQKQYPPLTQGCHSIYFARDNVQLTLLFGDAVEQLSVLDKRITSQVDAWFLDGFAPSCNPEMWNDELYQALYKLSVSNTTISTYTVAGKVRRGLSKAGFTVQKTKGFGTKREMLRAILE